MPNATKLHLCFLGYLLCWPQWVIMPAFKHENYNGPLDVERCINDLFCFTSLFHHIGKKWYAIFKMCMGYRGDRHSHVNLQKKCAYFEYDY